MLVFFLHRQQRACSLLAHVLSLSCQSVPGHVLFGSVVCFEWQKGDSNELGACAVHFVVFSHLSP